MAIRLLPFRDYDEHDVVNLYRMDGSKGDFIDLSNACRRSTAKGDAGVFVKVKMETWAETQATHGIQSIFLPHQKTACLVSLITQMLDGMFIHKLHSLLRQLILQ